MHAEWLFSNRKTLEKDRTLLPFVQVRPAFVWQPCFCQLLQRLSSITNGLVATATLWPMTSTSRNGNWQAFLLLVHCLIVLQAHIRHELRDSSVDPLASFLPDPPDCTAPRCQNGRWADESQLVDHCWDYNILLDVSCESPYHHLCPSYLLWNQYTPQQWFRC